MIYPASKWALRSLVTIRSGIPRFVEDVRGEILELVELSGTLFVEMEGQVSSKML